RQERRDHPALGDPAAPGGLQHQPEQLQDLAILNPTGYLAEQQIVPHGVEGTGHTLPTSKAFHPTSRSPVHTIPLQAAPSLSWGGHIVVVSSSWCSFFRTAAAPACP